MASRLRSLCSALMVLALGGSALLVAMALLSAAPHESSATLKTLPWSGIGAAPTAGAPGGSGSESSPAGAAPCSSADRNSEPRCYDCEGAAGDSAAHEALPRILKRRL